MPSTLATQAVEIRRIGVEGQPGQKGLLQDPISTNKMLWERGSGGGGTYLSCGRSK
jgi:hypothetical protein